LAAHLPQLWTPRGLDLVLALGPGALFVPLLVPLLRGIERRFHALRAEGERLQALAERDVLIGLYNRRAGERFLSTLLAHARDDAALVLFDIDHFKRINDRHGHPAGDAVLIEVGRRCAARLGRDDIFARWGGEEFLVLVRGTREDGGLSAAEHLRRAVCELPIEPVGTVSASFGVARFRPSDTVATWVARADTALYAAKSAGRRLMVPPGAASAASTVTSAAVRVQWAQGYSWCNGVSMSEVQPGSRSVSGLPSSSALRIAVIGRQNS
jgi:diguanylate cyclase (GGDEF)-like protein